MGNFTKNFSDKLSNTNKQYKRNLYQTYLTAPEWRNVEMSEEFAAFLQENKPFYRYPFFRQIYVFWHVFYQSYAAARKYHGHLELIFSEYMLMNLFIGINSTLEFAAKGIASLFLWPFLRKENPTEFQTHLAGVFKDYADFIHHTPFYNYSYFAKLRHLYSSFWNSQGKRLADWVSLLIVSVDFIAHGIISAPVGFWYNKEENKAPETIDIIVKQSIPDAVDIETFAQQLSSKVEAIEGVTVVRENDTPVVEIKTSSNPELKPNAAYAHLRVPRYEQFQTTVEHLATLGFCVREIAGQHHLQVKLVASGDSESQLQESLGQVTKVRGTTPLYTYKNGLNNGQTFFAIDLDTRYLKEAIEEIHQIDGVSIKLMHDF